jgi:hypothetical protein
MISLLLCRIKNVKKLNEGMKELIDE